MQFECIENDKKQEKHNRIEAISVSKLYKHTHTHEQEMKIDQKRALCVCVVLI